MQRPRISDVCGHFCMQFILLQKRFLKTLLVLGLAGCQSKPDTTVRVTSCTLVQHENEVHRWTVAMYTLKGNRMEIKAESTMDSCYVPVGTRYSVGSGVVEVVSEDDLPRTSAGLRHGTVLQITSESLK
jgi:hypothetical protein